MSKLKIERPKFNYNIFDEIRYFPYTEKEYRVGMKLMDMIRKSDLFDFIEKPSYERNIFQYFLSRDVADNMGVKLVTLKIYNHNDELFYEEVLSSTSSIGIDGTIEFYQHSSELPYPDLTRYEMVGWSERYKQEIVIQHWGGKFFEETLRKELMGQYGLHPNMKTYKLLTDEIKKEINRRIQQCQMSNRDPRTFGGRDIRRGVEGEMRNVTIGIDFAE